MKLKNISNILKSSGFKNIELDSIIESNQVLKRSGGNFRQYLFSFYDQNYKEWTLIPDLSLASVKKYIESKTNNKTKWSYSGEAYRKQDKSNKSPIVKQTGFEIFGSYNKAKDDNEIIQTSLKIFKKSNFKKCELNLSNMEIFHVLVDKLSLPLRWREKIKRHFSRKEYFEELLKKLSDDKDINPKIVETDKRLFEKLRKSNLEKIYSGRSLKNILDRFDLKNYKDVRDQSNKKDIKIIREYLKISCPIEKAPEVLTNFFYKYNMNIFISSDYFPIKKNNIKNVKVLFTSNINRTVEYYTGMNFNLMVDIKKKKNTLLSGGRFDKLIGNLASKNIPAVGAALNSNIL
jgi:ATP phosphoribosyltransferase regulatory subunit